MAEPIKSVTDILTGTDPEAEKRMKRQRALASVGVLMGTQPTASVGEMLMKDANNERDLNAEIAAKAADIQRRAAERAEDNDWKQQTQADLNAYRQASLANRGGGGGLTEKQRLDVEWRQQQAARAEEAKAAAARAKRLATLSQNISNSGAAELNQAVHDVNSTLGRYQGKDIPGVGGMSNVPLIGRFTGGEEGRAVRSQIAAVRNALLKARSGGAVTESEAARMEEELGTMLGASDETLRTNWPKFVDRYNATLGGIIGSNSDLVGEYQQSNPRFRGYVPSKPGGASPQQSNRAPSVPAGGVTHRFNPATGKVEEVR